MWSGVMNVYEKARQMKKVFCFNNCASRVFRTNLVLVWFQCCPSYLSRKRKSREHFSASAYGLGFKKLSLDSLFSTSVTWTTLQSDEDKFVRRLGSTIIETKYYCLITFFNFLQNNQIGNLIFLNFCLYISSSISNNGM